MRLVLILILVFLNCKDKKYLRIDDEKESGSMISMRDFSRLSYTKDGVLEWKLLGKESYIYPTDNRTVVYGFEFYQYDGGKYKSYLTGKRGEINHSTKSVLLEGEVNLKTEDGKILKSENLNYNLDEKTLSTDSEVVIYSDGTTIRGKGLRADKGLNKYTVLRPTAITVGGTSPLKEK
ncbi:LPS export ABC transporter periplasmic protein LptC [Leptospira ognonensis]|uniref:LPS export ABC transporter periplasmic protein LptC n=1 Tax=Leptospira ognonensis TaxID=2484945 RepID=A0A4R9JXW3_9LEPT|nr:LPS export ABC transporter periplasmic protein LptC [Leptospira ognonensis]TGL57397.1 LPS export ABC transporter periplasmic protein LptC [Leptospira ognonensis]